MTEYQFKYTYLFPQTGGGVRWIASRDETYEALGLTMPPEAEEFPFLANALGYWRTDDLSNQPAQRLFYREEPQTKDYQNIILFPHDGYEDQSGNLHYLYWIKGQSTRGNWRVRHTALTPSGELINDVQLPDEIGAYSNIFQDGEGKFWILGSGGLLFPAGQDGFSLGAPYPFDLGGTEVSYAGFYIACPRHGTIIEDVVDVVFPTNGGRTWIYFQLDLPDM